MTSKTAKKQILAAKVSTLKSLNNEAALKYELSVFFQKLKEKVLHELDEYYNSDFMFQAHADLILAPIFESHQEYYNILRKYNHKEYQHGRTTGRRLVKLAKQTARKKSIPCADKAENLMNAIIRKDELFKTNPWAEEKLLQQSFTASENTINRIDSDINKILSDGYKSGMGINKVRDDIIKRFDQLKDWEATRIARTEIHNAHNMGTMDIYQEMNVQYTQWIAAHDTRTRDSHRGKEYGGVDRQIIPMGSTYSNGLRYPGDTSGPIKEWINCRCSHAPFIIPYGYAAPSFTPFYEDDLITTLDYFNADELIATATQEAQITPFDEEKFKALKTNEEIAEFFGYDYIPQGRYYEQANIKTFEFYDKKTDTILRFAREGDQKCLNIDFTNSGRCEYDLKDVLRIYDETHPNLKVGLDDITFLRGDRYTPGGDAGGCSVRIYDDNITHNFSKRGIQSEVEPLEHTLDHELGHIFSDSFLQENEFSVMDDVAYSIRKNFKNAGVSDDLHHQKKGLVPQKVSYYAEKNQSENFAEVTAGVSNLKRGNNYKIYGERVKRPAPEKPRGYLKDNPTLKEVQSRNPNQYEFVDDLLDHPEKVMKNWKSINQKRVKESRAHFNEFLKQEQNVVRAKQNMKEHNKYVLTEAEETRLKELSIKKEKEGKLKLHDRRVFNELSDRKEFNELRNKILLEGGDPNDYFAHSVRYEKLYKKFKDWVPKGKVEIKAIKINKKELNKNKDAFQLNSEEKKVYKQLKQNNAGLKEEEKIYKRALEDKVQLNRYHKQLAEGKLDSSFNETYIKLYNKHKKEWNLPELSTDLKFQISKPSHASDDLYKSIKEYGLNKKEVTELEYLKKKELIGQKLTSKELKQIEFLESKDRFAYLNSVRTQGGGLNYKENLEFKKLYKQLKTKLKLDKSILKQEVTGYTSDIPLDETADDFVKFKGTTDDGLLPNGEKIDDYFTKDARDMNIREQEVSQRWLGSDYKAFTNFEVDCGRDVKKFEKWIYEKAKAYEKDNSLLYYKYYYDKIVNRTTGNLLKTRAKELARSIAHDVPVLDDILNNQLKKNMTLWRVQENHNLGDAKVGDIIDFPNFRSTAISKEGALWFSGTNSKPMKYIIEIEAPTGTKGAYLAPIKKGTWSAPPEIGMGHPLHGQNYAREMEFLLKECKVEVVKIGGRKVKGANGEMLTPIKLRVVGYK